MSWIINKVIGRQRRKETKEIVIVTNRENADSG